MDPITHAIVGLAIAAACGEPLALSNPAVLGCVAGSVIPDGDIIAQIKGDYIYLKHHRGFSHSLPLLAIYAAVITGVLWLFFTQMPIKRVLMLCFLGSLSHVLLDITNSYGAQILWPFFRKKIAFDLLLIYDPVLIILSALIIVPFTRHIIPWYFIGIALLAYFAARYVMRQKAKEKILKHLEENYAIAKIRVIPSMFSLLNWHYIAEFYDGKIIGQFNFQTNHFNIIKTLKNIDQSLYNIAINTKIARYFKDFTPAFHINCEQRDKDYIFRFVDLRYLIGKDFLHHATAVISKDLLVVKSLFHPYGKGKNMKI